MKHLQQLLAFKPLMKPRTNDETAETDLHGCEATKQNWSAFVRGDPLAIFDETRETCNTNELLNLNVTFRNEHVLRHCWHRFNANALIN